LQFLKIKTRIKPALLAFLLALKILFNFIVQHNCNYVVDAGGASFFIVKHLLVILYY